MSLDLVRASKVSRGFWLSFLATFSMQKIANSSLSLSKLVCVVSIMLNPPFICGGCALRCALQCRVWLRFTGDALAQMRCCVPRANLHRFDDAHTSTISFGSTLFFAYSLPQNVRLVRTEIPVRDTSRKKVWKSTCKANFIVYNT